MTVPSNPTGQDFTSEADLPKPERGATAADIKPVEQLPAENVPNVSHLLDGADAGAGSLDSGDAQQGQEQQQQAVVPAEESQADTDK